MKKTKKRRPKTHGKSKKRALPPEAKKQRRSSTASRDGLRDFFADNPSEGASEIMAMMSKMNVSQLKEFVRILGKIQVLDEPDDDSEEDGPNFMEFLELCRSDDLRARARVEDLASLVSSTLKQLKVRSEAGEPRLLAGIAQLQSRLDEAAEDEDFPAQGLMTLAKTFADADWQVPDKLKLAVVRALEKNSEAQAGALDKQALVVNLLRLADDVDFDEFDLCEQLVTTLEAFPTELAAQLVGRLAEAGRGVLDRAMVGFALHREPAVAAAALDAWTKSEARPVDGLVVDRLALIRPWTPAERHPWIDAAIEALRSNAEPGAKRRSGRVERFGVTTCDSSGAQNILGSIREGPSFWTIAALADPSGFLAYTLIEDLTAAEASDSVENLMSVTVITETDMAAMANMLSLTVADGLSKGVPPKFRLVDVVERLGIGPLSPRAATASEIAEELLAELPEEATGAAALARAHGALDEAKWASVWVEIGPAVVELLDSAITVEEGVEMLLERHMPARKPFWAWVCARSALALRGPAERPPTADCVNLALIARDLVSDKPVEDLPFMMRIAELTAKLYMA